MNNNSYGKLSQSQWIGGGASSVNPAAIDDYTFTCEYRLIEGKKAVFAISARNRDNYTAVEIDHTSRRIFIYSINDNARGSGLPEKTFLGSSKGYRIDDCGICVINRLVISVENKTVRVSLNGRQDMDGPVPMPARNGLVPRNDKMMLIGINALGGAVEIRNASVTSGGIRLDRGSLAVLGGEKWLRLKDCFELFCPSPCITVRRKISVAKPVRSAIMYSSARGFYNAYMNGKKIGNEYFAPGFTDYRLRIDYQKYDIAPMLGNGENILSAVVAQGYYTGYAGYMTEPGVYGKYNSFIARVEIEYADGTSDTIVTDESWELAECGPVIHADYLQGEYYDARLEDEGVSWEPCRIMPPPAVPEPTNGHIDGLTFTMTEQDYPPAIKAAELPGKPMGAHPAGHLVFDIGQNIVGTARIRLRGKRGDAIKVRYGEMCRRDGSVYLANLRSAANTDIYILKGSENGETFCPNLTAHGFRYVDISGCGGSINDISIESVDGIVISNMGAVRGHFECSDPLVNKLYSNTVWSQRDNFLLLPTDCPQRNERMGWTGDAQVFAKTAAYNADVYGFMRKWLRDLREAQLMYNQNGSVPDIAPLCGDNRGGCAGWADAAVIVPWEMYLAYGDKTVLEENYEMMKAWVEFQNSPERRCCGMRIIDGKEQPDRSDLSETGYIQPQQRRGDHLTFDESTPFMLSATAYAAYSAELMAKAADALGKPEDAKRYNEIHGLIKRSFNEAWVQPDGTLAYWGEMSKGGINETRYSENSLQHPSQTAYALAIDFGLIEINERVRDCFRRTVTERGGRLSVGFLGISHLHPALMKCGLAAEAFGLLLQEENPGWLYSVKNGATTIWERWNSYIAETDTFGEVSMNSFNHYAYGAVCAWMMSDILGIRPAKPGYAEIELRPHFGGTLTCAEGFHDTPRGRIESGWRIGNGRFIYTCSIPAVAKATLTMPDGKTYELCEGRHTVEAEYRA